MKIYIRENGITFVGKAWQIRYLLKKYMKQFDTIEEWIASHSQLK
ncbi:Z-ring formation inhibitor MciZ [Pueribacillus sp. YX66]